MEISLAQVMEGFSLSCTIIICSQGKELLPASSVAIKVIMVSPKENGSSKLRLSLLVYETLMFSTAVILSLNWGAGIVWVAKQLPASVDKVNSSEHKIVGASVSSGIPNRTKSLPSPPW